MKTAQGVEPYILGYDPYVFACGNTEYWAWELKHLPDKLLSDAQKVICGHPTGAWSLVWPRRYPDCRVEERRKDTSLVTRLTQWWVTGLMETVLRCFVRRLVLKGIMQGWWWWWWWKRDPWRYGKFPSPYSTIALPFIRLFCCFH